MIDDNDETRWGSRWRGPVPAMQKKHQGVSSANCCWWLRQQELTSSPPSLLPFSCRWPSTRTRHWRETWCEALLLAARPMPSSTWSWAWLPATLFFVSGILYKEIPFENTHYAAPLLLWQTYDSFNGLTASGVLSAYGCWDQPIWWTHVYNHCHTCGERALSRGRHSLAEPTPKQG